MQVPSKILFVGDPHGRPEDLDDCESLITMVRLVADAQDVETIVFLGDQHHTMAVIRAEVLGFWRRALTDLGSHWRVVFLLGNHDMPGDASSFSHALMAYEDMVNVTVVDRPTIGVYDGHLYMPYYHDPAKFVSDAGFYKTTTGVLICHQTFQGADYGAFFAKEGVDPEAIPQTTVISGHIHKAQTFGKVHYLGSPRWMTVDDANSEKFLTVATFAEDGSISYQYFPTGDYCRRIIKLKDTPAAPAEATFNEKDRYYVDIEGPQEWIDQRRPLFAGHARVVTRRTDKATAKVRESEGIDKALKKYLAAFKPSNGTPTGVLEDLVNARIFPR